MYLSARDAGYEDQGPAILGVSTGLMSFAFLLVTVRVVYRLRSTGVRADDWLITAAILLSLGHSVNDCISVVYYGYGKHEVDLTPAQKAAGKATGAALGFWITQIFYKLSLMCTKLSVCFLYRRIFERANRAFNITLWAVTGLIGAYYLAVVLATIFECTPVTKSWIKSQPGHCVSVSAFFYANAGFNILTDVVVMALPIPIIYDLHLPRRQKLMLCCVFAVGLFATATSIIRIFTIAGTEDPDTTWGVSSSVLWSAAEINTAIICACLPMLRPPLQALFPRLFRSGNSSGGKYGYGYGDKYSSGSGKWNQSNNRYSGRANRRGPADPHSITMAMDPIDRHRSTAGLHGNSGRPRSEKSSDDEPYFIDRDDEDSTGILKKTDFTVVYETENSEEERRHQRRAGSKDIDAGVDRIEAAHPRTRDRVLPGVAM